MGSQEVDMEGLLDWVRHYAGHFLPPDQETDEVSERHVRHYITLEVITLEVLDRPDKEGRENRYTFRHVLQMLVALKARMLTGISVKALKGRLTRLTNDELLALLSQGMEVSFVPSATHAPSKPAKPARGNAGALRRIAEIRQGSEGYSRRRSSSSPWSEPPSSAPQVWWRHYPVLDTLELHLRDDFRFPVSAAEETHLVNSILEHLRRHSSKPR